MTKKFKILLTVFISASIVSCYNHKEEKKAETKKIAHILTKEKQASLTPDKVVNSLKEGNNRFMENELHDRNYPSQVKLSNNGQFPKAVVLSCIDSRVPVEIVFDKGIGDLFVARVAGNIIDKSMLGSMEYACKVAGSKLVLVLGHEHCGAVKSAVKGVKLGNITDLLSKITPVVKSTEFKGEKSYKNKDFLHKVCENNVINSISEIRKQSPILKEMEDKGEIKIMGAVYDMDNGKVVFLN